jgi:hypothetical protein
MPLLEDLLAHLEPSELQTVQSALKKADKQGKERVLLPRNGLVRDEG